VGNGCSHSNPRLRSKRQNPFKDDSIYHQPFEVLHDTWRKFRAGPHGLTKAYLGRLQKLIEMQELCDLVEIMEAVFRDPGAKEIRTMAYFVPVWEDGANYPMRA